MKMDYVRKSGENRTLTLHKNSKTIKLDSSEIESLKELLQKVDEIDDICLVNNSRLTLHRG